MKFLQIKEDKKYKKYIVQRITERKGDQFMKLIPYEEKKVNKILEQITDKLISKIDSKPAFKQLLKQALSNLEWKEILKIHKKLERGVKPKAKNGCFKISVGSSDIDLIN